MFIKASGFPSSTVLNFVSVVGFFPRSLQILQDQLFPRVLQSGYFYVCCLYKLMLGNSIFNLKNNPVVIIFGKPQENLVKKCNILFLSNLSLYHVFQKNALVCFRDYSCYCFRFFFDKFTYKKLNHYRNYFFSKLF